MSDRKVSGIAVSLTFVCAAGYAPVRAAASQAMEIATFMDNTTAEDASPDNVVRNMVMSTLLISITTLVIAMCTSWKLCQQQRKPQTRDESTQTSPIPDSEVVTTRAQDATGDIFVYPQGRRFHTRWICRAVTGDKLELDVSQHYSENEKK
eukprot:4038089-Amphidinium_carterae.1